MTKNNYKDKKWKAKISLWKKDKKKINWKSLARSNSIVQGEHMDRSELE